MAVQTNGDGLTVYYLRLGIMLVRNNNKICILKYSRLRINTHEGSFLFFYNSPKQCVINTLKMSNLCLSQNIRIKQFKEAGKAFPYLKVLHIKKRFKLVRKCYQNY